MTTNQELFNAYVSEEFRKTAKETQEELNTKINRYLDEFRQHMDKVVTEIESKDYTSVFIQEADAVLEQTKQAEKQLAAIKDTVDALKQKTPALAAEIKALQDASTALKSDLDGIKQKAEQFGNSTGKFVASSVKQVITGGLPVF